MRRLAFTFLVSLLICACSGNQASRRGSPDGQQSAPVASGEWQPLFNGRDMEGWEHVGPGRFVIEDGLLRTEGGMGLLWYTGRKFGNCSIRVVYRVSAADSNSGVFVRIADKPRNEWFAVHHGYEIQICDSQDEYHRTGAVYSLSPSTSLPAAPPGQWNTMEITLNGPIIVVSLNGTEVNRFDPSRPVPERTKDWEPERGPRPEEGYIGIQNHDDYDTGTHVFFREISVRAL